MHERTGLRRLRRLHWLHWRHRWTNVNIVEPVVCNEPWSEPDWPLRKVSRGQQCTVCYKAQRVMGQGGCAAYASAPMIEVGFGGSRG